MPAEIHTIDALRGLIGQVVGASDWLEVTQDRIDQFAAATGDRQWIHCDPDRAARESPFGTTIAHGFLTLSLCAMLMEQVVSYPTARQMLNYGLNRVRFPNAVRCGSRIRLTIKLAEMHELSEAVEVQYDCTVEIDGQAKPACVANWVLRIYFH